MVNVQDARREMTKTKEQLEEEKRISLSIRIKPLDVDAMDSDQLRSKAAELWDTIVRLETEKYDLEERQKRQDYDVSMLQSQLFVFNFGQAAAVFAAFKLGTFLGEKKLAQQTRFCARLLTTMCYFWPKTNK